MKRIFADQIRADPFNPFHPCAILTGGRRFEQSTQKFCILEAMIRLVISVLLLMQVTGCSSHSGRKSSEKYYPVLRIVDGDTFRVNDGSEKGLSVRLIGVDAPESRNTGKKLKSEFGKESSAYLEKLIGGKRVRLEYDVDRLDRYGRTLAYVYLENGTFVNAELVRHGYAMVMTVPPNVKYQELFLKLSRRARNRGLGLWAEDS
jgi:micrococcal nuclease